MNSCRKFFTSGFVHLSLGLVLAVGVIAHATAADPVAASAPKSTVKLLTVGNSFSVNSTTYLPELAKAGGKTLIYLNCYKGGCSLKQHADGIDAIATAPESPAARIYTHKGALAAPDDRTHPFNLKEALLTDKWEIITIQQYSAESYKPESYEPYAKKVVDTIRQYAPQAEILVHETWSYREDDPLFKKGDFTQQKMYESLKAAYAKLAADYALRTIPIGDAFQAARATDRWHFVPDTTFDFANAKDGEKPNQKGSLNMGWNWSVDKNTGARKLTLDAHHANTAGQYLGGAVFYEILFNDDVQKANFCPKGLTPEEAVDLRRIAHETVQAQIASTAKK